MTTWVPSIPIKCTCFTDEPQCIDIAEYLGVVDWSKVKVDTPILVRSYESTKWVKRHFAFFKNEKVYTWDGGLTSWTCDDINDSMSWECAKLAEV